MHHHWVGHTDLHVVPLEYGACRSAAALLPWHGWLACSHLGTRKSQCAGHPKAPVYQCLIALRTMACNSSSIWHCGIVHIWQLCSCDGYVTSLHTTSVWKGPAPHLHTQRSSCCTRILRRWQIAESKQLHHMTTGQGDTLLEDCVPFNERQAPHDKCSMPCHQAKLCNRSPASH